VQIAIVEMGMRKAGRARNVGQGVVLGDTELIPIRSDKDERGLTPR